MKQVICPKCFARYPSEDRMLVCQNTACDVNGEPVRGVDAPLAENGQRCCASCGREITLHLCPQCGFELSGHAPGSEMLGISMVGAERCGKSHFLTVMVNSIRKEMARVYGCSLYPLGGDATIQQYNRQYYTPLFVQGHTLSSTAQEDIEPLIYSLVFPDGSPNGKTASLTFYDACGANFYDEREMEQSNRNIYNSRGILFMIDPSQFPIIRDRRRAAGKPVCDVDPGTLLSRTIHLIRAGVGQNDIRRKITIPIAVCLSKMDIVRPWLNPASYVGEASRHLRGPRFDLLDFECTGLEIVSLIESWSGRELVNNIRSQFASYGFFAFSSLGEEPSEDGRVQHIRPHRIMDPLLWILMQNHIIKPSKN